MMSRTLNSRYLRLAVLIPLAAAGMACGGGVPVRLHIDEFTMELALDEIVAGTFEQLKDQGILPQETTALPEKWPDSLPRIQYRTLLATAPVPVDLTPEPGTAEAEKYAQINQAQELISRIEMNRFILRIEDSNLSIPLPELRLQIADAVDADPRDRLAWQTIGVLPSAATGFIGDVEFEWIPGGESFLNSQLRDEKKEFAMRVQGKVDVDTDLQPNLPRGKAVVRLIVVATFFVNPTSAIDAAASGDLTGAGAGGGDGGGGGG